jgi:radical SAM protein with 4Fe4S-binding SPASM domain
VCIPPLEKIEITVYGMKKSSYEGVTRTAGSFKLFQSGVKLLLEKKIPFLVKAALLPQNREEIDLVKKWAMTIPGMNRPPLFSFFFNLRCRRERRKNILIKKLRLSGDEGFKILLRNKKEYIKEVKDFSSKFMYPTGDKIFSCGAGRGGGCVDAYGRFQPCLMLRSPECSYDLKTGSLKDALENFFPKLRERTVLNPEYLKRCAKCFLKGFCEQCPARSWEEHGTLDTPVEYCCEVAHALARSLGLLKNEEKGWEIRDYRARIKEFVNNDV